MSWSNLKYFRAARFLYTVWWNAVPNRRLMATYLTVCGINLLLGLTLLLRGFMLHATSKDIILLVSSFIHICIGFGLIPAFHAMGTTVLRYVLPSTTATLFLTPLACIFIDGSMSFLTVTLMLVLSHVCVYMHTFNCIFPRRGTVTNPFLRLSKTIALVRQHHTYVLLSCGALIVLALLVLPTPTQTHTIVLDADIRNKVIVCSTLFTMFLALIKCRHQRSLQLIFYASFCMAVGVILPSLSPVVVALLFLCAFSLCIWLVWKDTLDTLKDQLQKQSMHEYLYIFG